MALGAGSLLGLAKEARAAGGELLELSARPTNYETPRSVFTERITPTEQFYIRSHFDAPEVNAASWRLKISGLVEEPLELSLEELSKMQQTSVEAVLQCAGNGRALFRPRMPGVQWRYGAMGSAEWRGVRLMDLIQRARPKKEAKHLRLQGLDKPLLSAPPFLRGIPMEKALHPDTLVALSMNGAPLPPLHGFPARLIVPGWVGDDWVKWLAEIELRATEPEGFFYETAYRFPSKPRPAGEAVPPEEMKPMTRLNVKSLIATPGAGQVLAPGVHEIVGVAFSGEAAIAKVEVTVDGKRWVKASLDPSPSKYGFRVFRWSWKAKPGRFSLASRATDEKGATQPKAAAWNPSGYLFNAIDPIAVEVRA
jgi:DMSO/TMAO reductase YedYZ molybdopterin-dependent catalytic subunit